MKRIAIAVALLAALGAACAKAEAEPVKQEPLANQNAVIQAVARAEIRADHIQKLKAAGLPASKIRTIR